jgi:ketosteroid isomerase-like protein
MTSSEALAVVQAFLELVATGDDARLSDSLDPDVVWYGTRGGLDESRVIRGPDAVLDYIREVREPWQRFDVEVEQLIEAGDAVVVFMHETAQARHGGPELQDDTAVIIKVRRRRIVEMAGYLDRDEALRAARLGEARFDAT